MLILVRHAMPDFDPRVPPDEWPLSEAGRSAAAVLAGDLPAGSCLVASTETKAWQTLEAAGQVDRDPRFAEVRRVEPWEGDFRRLRREYVEGVDHPDWEPRTQVAERFDTAITEYLDTARGRPLVVASHGMAMTVWLTARVGLPDPGAFWAGLRFPAVCRVDLATKSIGTLTDESRSFSGLAERP